MHIALIGDSVFDNASYVSVGDSVHELLSKRIPESKVSLVAKDGSTTKETTLQIASIPHDATHIFISCGGNNALRQLPLLENKASTIGDALDSLHTMRETFRIEYRTMLNTIVKCQTKVYACTIYNNIPGISARAQTALALFNEIILEELALKHIPPVDLRVICKEPGDYSSISPIEPSRNGGEKIADALLKSLSNGC